MSNNPPLVIAYGLGVDSTAALVGLQRLNIRPDAILFADTKAEKAETYAYLPVIQAWLAQVGFPAVTVVQQQVRNFKHWPPYQGLAQNCLTNGTLPSLAFGFKSCSLKWKVQPQNAWTKQWQPAIDCWESGEKVRKVIGYDAGAKDRKRYAHAQDKEDKAYDYWYPLIEWGWDRDECKRQIADAGLPVPPKSACVMCPATQPAELHEHRKAYLRLIVIMEARAKPRLDGCKTQEQLDAEWQQRTLAWQAKWDRIRNKFTGAALHKAEQQHLAKEPKRRLAGDGTAGLWRSKTKVRPAMMTDYILQEGLLSAEEVQELQARTPLIISENQEMFAREGRVESWEEFLARFDAGLETPDFHDLLEMTTPEDAIEEVGGCSLCLARA